MTRGALATIASTILVGSLLGGCIDDPVFIPLTDVPDAGNVADEGSAADAGTTQRPQNDAASPTSSCSERCTASGGTCDGDTCVLTCSSSSPCKGKRCPAGVACRIECAGKGSCDKLECVSSTACAVHCAGEQACNDLQVEAPNGQITCDGAQACGRVQCKGASCAIACGGDGCKADDVKCCASECTVDGRQGSCR